jgi:hypothetical protein
MTAKILIAAGVGQPAEADPPRRSHIRYLRAEGKRLGRSVHLTPWSSRFRFGWVLGWNGVFWSRAVGWAGPDWDDGQWLGGMSWHRSLGPLRFCSWRRRGSLRSERQFCRHMDCTCSHKGWLWPIEFEHLDGCPITVIHCDNTPSED